MIPSMSFRAKAARRVKWSSEQHSRSSHDIIVAAGLAEYFGEGLEAAKELERRADKSMQIAWRIGGSCSVVFTPEIAS